MTQEPDQLLGPLRKGSCPLTPILTCPPTHAKKELKKTVRGVRALERQVEGRDDALAEVVQGYCAAVRSALTDDGRPPLDAKGLLLEERLTAVCASLERAAEKGGRRGNCNGCGS